MTTYTRHVCQFNVRRLLVHVYTHLMNSTTSVHVLQQSSVCYKNIVTYSVSADSNCTVNIYYSQNFIFKKLKIPNAAGALKPLKLFATFQLGKMIHSKKIIHWCKEKQTRSISWHFFNASPNLPIFWYARAHSSSNHMHCISWRFSIAATPSCDQYTTSSQTDDNPGSTASSC